MKLNWQRCFFIRVPYDALLESECNKNYKINCSNSQIAVPEGERRNLSALYNPFTIDQLQAKYPYLDWLSYIDALLPPGVDINGNELLIVDVPDYFTKLGPILWATPKRTIANYFGNYS